MTTIPAENRYDVMPYNRCGKSGLLLPAISLGLWHNFGEITPRDVQRRVLRAAFDHGITHFDLANNYGPPPGEAERNFGEILRLDFSAHRDEMILSTKAGYDMWPGPYGNWGSRKSLIASIDQSLKRLNVEYVDIFYHHRPDPDTPLEETMGALRSIVESGKALYVGLSRYSPEKTREAVRMARDMGIPLVIHQVNYSMLKREPEQGLMDVLRREGLGMIAFGPLAGGRLTGKYQCGIPEDSRAARDPRFLKPEMITQGLRSCTASLSEIARERGESLSQLALQWVLRDGTVTSALIGASSPEQIDENVRALSFPPLSTQECAQIDAILSRYDDA